MRIRRLLRSTGLAALSLWIAQPSFAAAPTKPSRGYVDLQFTLINNGEAVGHLDASGNRRHLSLDYYVDENGRGPKHRQEISFNAQGLPTAGTIKGTSLMGGKVDEAFSSTSSRFTWQSQADKGDQSTSPAKLYVINDSNPYDLAIYARYLLSQPGQKTEVLPDGVLSLTKLNTATFGHGPQAVSGTLYELDGLDLDPAYIVLDQRKELFAAAGLIRKGFEAEMPKLNALLTDAEASRQTRLQSQLGHRYGGVVRIRNVHVFDPRQGTLGPLVSVMVAGNRITSIIPEADADKDAPTDETIIDGASGTLVPGLHDMHSHTTRTSGLYLLAAGVTATRDMGNDNGFLDTEIPLIDKGEIAGPRIIRNGFLEGRSPYSARDGIIVATQADALKAVRYYADHGYFQMKLYNSFNPDWVKATADEAHALGMHVVGHIPAFDTPDRAIVDGYDEVTHINQLALGWLLKPGEDTRTPLRLTALARASTLDLDSAPVQATFDLMKAHHTSLDTTMVIVERLMLSRAGTVLSGDDYYLDHMPVSYRRYRMRTYVPIAGPAEDTAYRQGFDKLIEVISRLHKQGTQLLPGTDDTLGFSVRRELELYVLAGLTPAEALRVDTLDMETYLHRDEQAGTIERGKLADFILVDGDPTQDITALHKTRTVVKDGIVYYPNEIYDALGVKPFTTAPKVTPPAVPLTPPAPGEPKTDGFDEFD